MSDLCKSSSAIFTLDASTRTIVSSMAKDKLKSNAASKAHRDTEGRKIISGWFPVEASVQLKVLAANQQTTVQGLLTEALNLLFAKHGLKKITE